MEQLNELLGEIQRDHGDILERFNLVLGFGVESDRQIVFRILLKNLVNHQEAEQEVFDALRRYHDLGVDRQLVAEILNNADQEEAQFDSVLEAMDRFSVTDKNWREGLLFFQKEVMAHFEQEEREIFPEVREIARVARKSDEVLKRYRLTRDVLETAA